MRNLNEIERKYLLAEREYIDFLLEKGNLNEDIQYTGYLGRFNTDIYLMWRESFDRISSLINEVTEMREEIKNLRPEFRCIYTDSSTGHINLTVTPGHRKEAFEYLKDFTKGSKDLVIVDPYFYGGEADEIRADSYIGEVAKSIKLQKLNSLHIIYSSRHGKTSNIKRSIKELASEYSVTLTHADTDLIHDRIWIKDRSEALVIGTSLGGLGRSRVSFIIPLPNDDLQEFIKFLTINKLI